MDENALLVQFWKLWEKGMCGETPQASWSEHEIRERERENIKYWSTILVNGGWSSWNGMPWSSTCTSDGANLTRVLYRQCNAPWPMFGGDACMGDMIKTEEKMAPLCPCEHIIFLSNWITQSQKAFLTFSLICRPKNFKRPSIINTH